MRPAILPDKRLTPQAMIPLEARGLVEFGGLQPDPAGDGACLGTADAGVIGAGEGALAVEVKGGTEGAVEDCGRRRDFFLLEFEQVAAGGIGGGGAIP